MFCTIDLCLMPFLTQLRDSLDPKAIYIKYKVHLCVNASVLPVFLNIVLVRSMMDTGKSFWQPGNSVGLGWQRLTDKIQVMKLCRSEKMFSKNSKWKIEQLIIKGSDWHKANFIKIVMIGWKQSYVSFSSVLHFPFLIHSKFPFIISGTRSISNEIKK